MSEVDDLRAENKKLRLALSFIAASGCDVSRYRNMRAFPVVVSLCQRMTNMAADALEHTPPFPDHPSANNAARKI
jgi:hypothetical protein